MQKQTVFHNRLLPFVLLVPQLAIVLVFFYWPAAQAVWQSFLLQDAFGLSTTFVAFENYAELLQQPEYFATIVRTSPSRRRSRARRCRSPCCSR